MKKGRPMKKWRPIRRVDAAQLNMPPKTLVNSLIKTPEISGAIPYIALNRCAVRYAASIAIKRQEIGG